MLIRSSSKIKSSEITSHSVYQARRDFMRDMGGLALAGLAPAACSSTEAEGQSKKTQEKRFAHLERSPFSTDETPTPHSKITHYNNFYELGTGKSDPAKYAHRLRTQPWSVTIDGAVEKPGTYQLEDILKPHTLEERIYRLRCVETWSMVVPWVGFSLGDLLKRFQPTSKAKFVAFETLHDPEQMPGQRSLFSLQWPYAEGLRMDEALHPLTLLAVGLYGEVLPSQNGAPIRLVVPWKYGFKSIKSLVRITLLEEQPPTTWHLMAPDEYGFYANVNPDVSHPRWSQAKERRLGGSFFENLIKQETLPFNGYAEQVAHLYQGMDLHQHF